MNKKFQQVSIAQVGDYICDSEALQKLSVSEPIFVVTNHKKPESNKLVDLEVSIRKGKRVGALK